MATGGLDQDKTINCRVDTILADEHHEFLRVNLPVAGVMGALISVSLLPFSSPPRVAIGFALLLACHLTGWLVLRQLDDIDAAQRIRVFAVLNGIAGVAWGLFWWCSLPTDPQAQLCVAIAIPFAMAINMVEAGSVPASFLGFHVPYSIITVIVFATSTSGTPRWAALVFTLMSIYVLVLARVMARSARQRAELTIRNADLIGALNDANGDLERESTHDRLTGLANRLALERALEAMFEEQARSAGEFGEIVALYVDLDRFKDVNDTRGHAEGDELLVRVARRCRQVLPDDGFAARMGGDELVVLLPGRPSEIDGQLLAGELVDKMAEPFTLSSGPVEIGASVGVAITSPHCSTPRNLLRDADSALYAAKATGGSRWVFYEDPVRGPAPCPQTDPRIGNRLAVSGEGRG